LRLGFQGENQLPIAHHQQIPLLRGAKKAGEIEGGAVEDVFLLNTRFDNQLPE